MNYLNRVTRGSENERVSTRGDQAEESINRNAPTRHKSVDNAKAYAIYKMIGKLDTRRELEIVSSTSW